jgi:hypothetical protein
MEERAMIATIQFAPPSPLVIHGADDFPLAAEIASRRCQFCRRPIGLHRPFWYVTPAGNDVGHSDCWQRQGRVNSE